MQTVVLTTVLIAPPQIVSIVLMCQGSRLVVWPPHPPCTEMIQRWASVFYFYFFLFPPFPPIHHCLPITSIELPIQSTRCKWCFIWISPFLSSLMSFSLASLGNFDFLANYKQELVPVCYHHHLFPLPFLLQKSHRANHCGTNCGYSSCTQPCLDNIYLPGQHNTHTKKYSSTLLN